MKKLLLTALLALVPAVSFSQSVPYGGQGPSVDATGYGGIDAGSFGVKDAIVEVADDTVWHLSALADFDSSVTFNAITWDKIVAQAKFIGGATLTGVTGTTPNPSRDSNNVRIYWMGSIDGVNWSRRDSTSITDTLWNYDEVAWNGWPWCKVVTRGLAKIDSSGAAGQIRVGVKGAK